MEPLANTAPLNQREITTCEHLGVRLARREIDVETALRQLQRVARDEIGGTR